LCDDAAAMTDILFSAPAQRNSQPILEVLLRVLPAGGRALEIASGTGQHVVTFAGALPGWVWQPSDPDPRQRASISARITRSGLPNLLPPLDLNVCEAWGVPAASMDAVIVANLLHISSRNTLAALLEGASRVLRPGGMLHLYGPFKRDGAFTSQGNAAFDASLRSRHPDWGLRDLEVVMKTAGENGFRCLEVNGMPASNFSLVWVRPHSDHLDTDSRNGQS
jgi:SAM-dependent methyltransferase